MTKDQDQENRLQNDLFEFCFTSIQKMFMQVLQTLLVGTLREVLLFL